MTIKFRICISGTSPQGVAVSKHERTFTADLKCDEEAERAVLEMVSKVIDEMARDLELAAENAMAAAALDNRLARALASALAANEEVMMRR